MLQPQTILNELIRARTLQAKDKADKKPRIPSAYNNFVKAESQKLRAEGKTQQVFERLLSITPERGSGEGVSLLHARNVHAEDEIALTQRIVPGCHA